VDYNDRINELANRLAKIPGWKNYALYCLNRDFSEENLPNENVPELVDVARFIKLQLLNENKLFK
jgi:hypothetical protein